MSEELKLPPVPPRGYGNEGHSDEAMREYAYQAVLAERQKIARGELICRRCGLRESACREQADFPDPEPSF